MFMIICAGESEQFDFALPVGIGMTDVAINLTTFMFVPKTKIYIVRRYSRFVWGKEIFDIVESKTAANIENSFFTGGSYTPIDNMVSTAEDVSRETIVNTSNYITTNKSVGKAIFLKISIWKIWNTMPY